MYPHEYSVKQSKKILKNKNIKGCSRYDKTQLNRKILTISNEEYHTVSYTHLTLPTNREV